MKKELGNRRTSREVKAVEVEDTRVGHVHCVVHTVFKFQKVVKVMRLGTWEMLEVENEDGSREVVGGHQVKDEVDPVCGV